MNIACGEMHTDLKLSGISNPNVCRVTLSAECGSSVSGAVEKNCLIVVT